MVFKTVQVINLLFMLQALSKTGIVTTLFLVEGDLVENYNKALETVIGKRTQQTSFHIDRRGESPELEEELGKNYLQSGPAHRYCIIISPDQKEADLMHEEFSFDSQLFDLLYENFLSGISLATRVDGLFGEIDDGVREFETLEDLLLAKHVHLELHTPSKFLTTARELHQCVEQLKNDPELLIENDSAFLRKIIQLVGQVGDVRGFDVRPIEATWEIKTFYTRLFGGVCVFRQVQHQKAGENERDSEVIYDLSGGQLISLGHKTIQPPQQEQEQGMSETVVVYRDKGYRPEDGPTVKFIPLQDKERVIRFLVEHSYAAYSCDLLEPRLSRLEDETLLKNDHDVTDLEREQRLQLLHTYRERMLFEWYELKEIKRKVMKGHTLSDVIHNYSASVQGMLLVSKTTDEDTTEVVEHLLTRLHEYDYEKMYTFNRRHLERLYERADENKQKYIVKVLKIED